MVIVLLLDQVMAMVFKARLKYHQLVLVVLLLFCWTMLTCSIAFQYIRERDYKIEHINDQLQLYNKYLAEHYFFENNLDEIHIPYEPIRISLINFEGRVFYDNKNDPKGLDNHLNRSEVKEAMKSGAGYTIDRTSNSDGLTYFYSASKYRNLIVRTAIPYSESLEETLSADMAFFWFMFTVTMIMSMLGWWVTRQLGQTITRLNRFAGKAEKGELISDVEAFPRNELGEISKHIINLYTKLQQTIVERDLKHEQALHQEQEKIRIKKQLTNDINHELKTPVASMQVCLETLLSGPKLPEEMRHKLMEQCYSNCERLRHLLNDVSLITRLEEGSLLIPKEKLVINDLVMEIKNELDFLPQEAKMKLNIEMQEHIVICGNKSLITSVFRNLTENALAYSEGENIYIIVDNTDKERVKVVFEDDGVGVSEEHLQRLFDRFYRIDKGRSRKLGGTGLGLSIVKHAIRFHGGDIRVLKSPRGGLRFEFTLQKNNKDYIS